MSEIKRKPMHVSVADHNTITELRQALSEKLGVQLNRTQVLRMALSELADRHLSDAA